MKDKQGNRHSPEFKFQVVLEALESEAEDAEIARKYNIHPVTLSNWKQHFRKHGSSVISSKEADGQKNKRIRELERMLGRKEVELALAKNFLDKS